MKHLGVKKRKARMRRIKVILITLFTSMIIAGIISVFGVSGGLECGNLSIRQAVIQWAVSAFSIGIGLGGRYLMK